MEINYAVLINDDVIGPFTCEEEAVQWIHEHKLKVATIRQMRGPAAPYGLDEMMRLIE